MPQGQGRELTELRTQKTKKYVSLTLNSDFLIWFILQRITDGKYTSVRGAVVVSANRIVNRY